MLHTCVQRFDVTKNFEKFYKSLETKQAPSFQKEKKIERGPYDWLSLLVHCLYILMGTPAARFLGGAEDRWVTTPS